MKTSELIGPALDWAVAKCEGRFLTKFDDHFRGMSNHSGHSPTRTDQLLNMQPLKGKRCVLVGNGFAQEIPAYSTNWVQGVPIIAREGILLRPIRKEGHKLNGQWLAMYDGGNTGSMVQWTGKFWFPRHYLMGTTPLIAAMRCYVASKLGDEVEIPKELLCG